MPDLQFQVEDVQPLHRAVSPQLAFKVRITNRDNREPIHSVALRVQVQIEPVRRRYSLQEKERMSELFGEPERWSQTLHPLLWENVNVNVQGFTESGVIEVPVHCTFDFNVAVTKYVYALENGEIPTSLLFSGTVFHSGRVGLQIAPIPWDREASFRLPVQVWKDLMDTYYPNSAWLCLRRDVFERLQQFRSRHGAASWEQTIDLLLEQSSRVKA